MDKKKIVILVMVLTIVFFMLIFFIRPSYNLSADNLKFEEAKELADVFQRYLSFSLCCSDTKCAGGAVCCNFGFRIAAGSQGSFRRGLRPEAAEDRSEMGF